MKKTTISNGIISVFLGSLAIFSPIFIIIIGLFNLIYLILILGAIIIGYLSHKQGDRNGKYGMILGIVAIIIIVGIFYVFTDVSKLHGPPRSYPNIVGGITTTDSNITISLIGNESLSSSDARIIITDAQDEDYRNNNPDNSVWNFNDSNYFLWTDSNDDGKIGPGDILKIYNPHGLESGFWRLQIIQKSTDKLTNDSWRIEIT
jgi:hypothetical protein